MVESGDKLGFMHETDESAVAFIFHDKVDNKKSVRTRR